MRQHYSFHNYLIPIYTQPERFIYEKQSLRHNIQFQFYATVRSVTWIPFVLLYKHISPYIYKSTPCSQTFQTILWSTQGFVHYISRLYSDEMFIMCITTERFKLSKASLRADTLPTNSRSPFTIINAIQVPHIYSIRYLSQSLSYIQAQTQHTIYSAEWNIQCTWLRTVLLRNITETPPVKSEHRPSTPHFDRIVRKHNLRSLYQRCTWEQANVALPAPGKWDGSRHISGSCMYINVIHYVHSLQQSSLCVSYATAYTDILAFPGYPERINDPPYVHQAIVGLYGGMAARCRHSDCVLYVWGWWA